MATISYRYSNDNIYIQQMRNTATDKANILLARADWRADGVVPTEQFDDVFPQWHAEHLSSITMAGAVDNSKAEAIRVGVPTENNTVMPRSFFPDPFYLTDMIYEKSTDEFVGFSRAWLNKGHSEHLITCFTPAKRGLGYHGDYSIIANKAWYLYSGGLTSEFYSPRGQTSIMVDNPNIDVFKVRHDRIDQVDYIRTQITKENWLAWMDRPENHTYRDQNFTMERYLEA